MRVERSLDAAHQRQLHLALVAAVLRALELPQPVLGADRAAARSHRRVHHLVDGALVREGRRQWRTRLRLHVVVQVAVAQVAEYHRLDPRELRRQRGVGAGDELGHPRHRQRDVVLDVAARLRLRLRDRLAQPPQRLGLGQRLGDHRVHRQPFLERDAEQAFEQDADARFVVRVGQLEQRKPRRRVRCQRQPLLRQLARHAAQTHVGHDLESSERSAGGGAGTVQQRGCRLQRGQGRQRRALGPRQGKEPERGRGDDAQGALGTDEQLLQVVARVVLAQAAQAVPDAAVGQHHLQAERQLARVAVTQHLGAAGVGGEVAADRGAALGGQTQRKQPSRRARCLLHLLQDAACLHRDGVVVGVERADAVHALQAQQHRVAALVGRAAAHQPGVAPLRNHRRARGRAGLHHGSHLGRAAGPHHRLGAAVVALAPVGEIGRRVGGFGEHVGRPDGRA